MVKAVPLSSTDFAYDVRITVQFLSPIAVADHRRRLERRTIIIIG
jgi:hypothetical protein